MEEEAVLVESTQLDYHETKDVNSFDFKEFAQNNWDGIAIVVLTIIIFVFVLKNKESKRRY